MRAPLLLAGASLVVLTAAAGCGQAGQAAAPSSTPAPPPSAAPSSSAVPSSSAAASASSQATSATEAVPAGGNCGTVTAASGLTLQVLDSSSSGVACADATRLVTQFQQQIAGKQPAGSNQPVSATVEGWLCVSGPPAAQGGTTCSQDQKTVFATVAAE